MAGSVNKAIIIGHLGSDPEVRYTPGGQAVANFNVATNEVWNDKQGQRQERTEWHRIVVWGKVAETCGEYLKRGRQAYIEGRLQTRQWDDREGHKRYTTEIVAQQVVFLGGRGEGGSAGMARSSGGEGSGRGEGADAGMAPGGGGQPAGDSMGGAGGGGGPDFGPPPVVDEDVPF